MELHAEVYREKVGGPANERRDWGWRVMGGQSL